MKKLMVLMTLAFAVPAFANSDDNRVVIRHPNGLAEIISRSQSEKFQDLNSFRYERSLKSLSALHVEAPAFTPSVITMAEATNLFNRMNRNYRRKSECSDRAHVWAYDEFTKNGLMGQKAFIFFTDAYIKRTGFKWWFHVAPMYDVQTGNGVQKMVFDYMYMSRPVPVAEWKNLMVHSGRECVTEFNFNDYNAGADQTQDCYMRFTSMYYHFPADIGASENGTFRTSFNDAEVNSTRARAFNTGSL